MPADARARVIYRGTVQGVGFRYTVRRLAGDGSAAGFVRNQADGTVELVAEAARPQLARLLESIDDAMSGYIAGKDIEWSEPTGEFSDFGIRF